MKDAAKHSFRFLPIALIAAVSTMGFQAVAAQSPPANKPKPTATISYVRIDNNGGPTRIVESPCASTKVCANGIRFLWKANKCVKTPGNPPFDDRYPPLPVVYREKSQVAPSIPPQIAPCSTGIQESWSPKDVLNKPLWRGASNPASGQQHFPKNAIGVDLFLQAGDALTGIQWMKNGKTDGALIPVPSSANDVYWYSGSPPPVLGASRRALVVRSSIQRHTLPAPPTVVILGRSSKGPDVTTTDKAPPGANDVDFQWYQAKGTIRGCVVYDGHTWTSPSMAFEYTSGGRLNSRVTVLQCPRDAHGNVILVNGVDFKWRPATDGSENVVYSAVATDYGSEALGVPAGAIPQPPATTDGIQIGFHHNDYQQASWTKNGASLTPNLSNPSHQVIATWYGGAVGTW